jgi:hypothetical protein
MDPSWTYTGVAVKNAAQTATRAFFHKYNGGLQKI